MVEHLRTHFPEPMAVHSDQDLFDRVDAAVGRAAKTGFEKRRDVRRARYCLDHFVTMRKTACLLARL
jgi:hypothetical protein